MPLYAIDFVVMATTLQIKKKIEKNNKTHLMYYIPWNHYVPWNHSTLETFIEF